MKRIYIAAYHQSKFGKLMAMSVPEIIQNAVNGACSEIGVEPAVLDVGSIGATCNISLNLALTIFRENVEANLLFALRQYILSVWANHRRLSFCCESSSRAPDHRTCNCSGLVATADVRPCPSRCR